MLKLHYAVLFRSHQCFLFHHCCFQLNQYFLIPYPVFKGLHTPDAFFLFVCLFFVRLICTTKIFYELLIGHEYFYTECESHCKNATLLFFGSRWIFPNIRTVSKRLNQSWWLCRENVMSVSHNNNINIKGWQAYYLCLLAPSLSKSIADQLGYVNGNVSLRWGNSANLCYIWEALWTFHLSMWLTRRWCLWCDVVVFLLSILCLMAHKFCYVLLLCMYHVSPFFLIWSELSKLLGNSCSHNSVAKSCCCRWEEFWSEHFTSAQFAFVLFVTHHIKSNNNISLSLIIIY